MAVNEFLISCPSTATKLVSFCHLALFVLSPVNCLEAIDCANIENMVLNGFAVPWVESNPLQMSFP